MQLPNCPIFKFTGAAGEPVLLTVWDGRQDFANDIPPEIIRLVGGEKIALVQVSTPVGRNGRSSIALSDVIVSCGYSGIIHWARDTATYKSIIDEFKQRHLIRGNPPELPVGWKPVVTVLACNG